MDKRLEGPVKFLRDIDDLLQNQPSAEDLKSSTEWLTMLNGMYSRWSQVHGEVQSLYARLIYTMISAMSDEEYKKIKTSSTLTDLYIRGKYPEFSEVHERLTVMEKVLSQVSQNTRTLMSSWRAQNDFSNRQSSAESTPQNDSK